MGTHRLCLGLLLISVIASFAIWDNVYAEDGKPQDTISFGDSELQKIQQEKIQPYANPSEIDSRQLYGQAIETYHDALNFVKSIFSIVIVIIIGTAGGAWVAYLKMRKTTQEEITKFQKQAEADIRAFEEQIRSEANKREAMSGLIHGWSLFQIRKPLEAEPLLKRALETGEELPADWIFFGHATLADLYYYDIGRSDLAIEHCDEAIALNPNDPYVRIIKARALWLERKYEDARKDLKSAEDLVERGRYPSDLLARIYVIRGHIYADNDYSDRAKEMYDKAKSLIDKAIVRIPVGSSEWSEYDRVRGEAEGGITKLGLKNLLQERYKAIPDSRDIEDLHRGMALHYLMLTKLSM